MKYNCIIAVKKARFLLVSMLMLLACSASAQKEVSGKVLDETGIKKVTIAGGVSCNKYLRSQFDKFTAKGIEVHYPKLQYCTDNASMIGSAAYFMIKEGLQPTALDLDAKATVPLK